MCGFFGIVTDHEQELGPLLIEAGKRMSYHGYDSVGCATLRVDGSIDLRKDVGKIEDVSCKLGFADMIGNRGIVQLRWATFGSPSKLNAQPHFDSDGDLVGAHNGNVVNNVDLQKQFHAEGMIVRSTNDGESCVHAVERYENQGFDMVQAIQHAYLDLAGDYAFVIGKAGEAGLCAIKKGTGLIVGIAEGATCVSSDLAPILLITRRIMRVQDGEIVSLWADHVELRRVIDGALVEREVEIVSYSVETAQKGGYAHFMLKEIHEQPQVARELIHLLEDSPNVLPFLERITSARHLYLLGCGSSYHATMLGAIYFSWLAGRPAFPVMAPQFITQYGPVLQPQDVVMFISQSGETKDVLNAVEITRQKEAGILGLINVIGSSLSRLVDDYLPLACGSEISIPATKTFINQLVAFLYLALKMGDVPTTSLNQLPDLLNTTLETVEPQLQSLIPILVDRDDIYYLGYGATYPIALEGALKLKKITYAHCEGMLSTEFKHGPLSAVQTGFPVVFVAGPQDTSVIVSGLNEVSCRGGRTIVIGEENSSIQENAHHSIILPQAGPLLNPMVATLPLQLLSYKLSLALGHDPDYPRNLSKTLTVD